MKLWGLMRGKRGLAPVGLPTRADVQDWAGQRHMPAGSYRDLRDNPSATWREVRRLHPEFRLVRVTLNGNERS